MFLKLPEWLNKNKNLIRPNRGIVKSNIDPKKLGRLKIEIPGFLEGLKIIELPWIYPVNSYGLGGKSSCSSFSVPEVGSELSVIFPYDDIYFGFYTGYWQSVTNHQSHFNTNYPNAYGWVDSTGLKLKVDKIMHAVDFIHPSGVTLSIDKLGNVSALTTKKRTEDIITDLDVNVGINTNIVVGSAINTIIGTAATTTIGTAATTNIGTASVVNVGTSATTTVGTAATLNVGSALTIGVGGVVALVSAGNVSIVAPLTTTLGLTALSGGNLQLLMNALFVPLFDSHTHTSSSSGSPTSPPITGIQPGMTTILTTAG